MKGGGERDVQVDSPRVEMAKGRSNWIKKKKQREREREREKRRRSIENSQCKLTIPRDRKNGHNEVEPGRFKGQLSPQIYPPQIYPRVFHL